MRKLINKISDLARKVGMNPKIERHSAVIKMQKKINALGSIQFKIEFYPDGSWTAESTNIDGIITGSRDTKEMNEIIKDAIFTYFRVPPYFVHNSLLKANNEPVTVEQRVWATR